jgi:predicted dehydrogenase
MKPPRDDAIRLGLVGLGDWGEQVALAAAMEPGVELVACYARTAETRAAFAARHDCRACASLEVLLAAPDIHGVVVMTPNNAHREPVVAAAGHGKHVLVTKPIATTIADGQAMIAACERAGVILAVGHQSRREPAIAALKETLDAGELGQPVLVEANISTARGLGIGPDEWRWRRDECPGGPLIQLGIHHVDTLQYLLGRIVRVQSWQRRSLVAAEFEDVTLTLLEFASGLPGYLGSSYAASMATWIKVYGTRALAHYDQLGGLTIHRDAWPTGPRRELRSAPLDFRRPPIPTMRAEVAEFAECIRTGKPLDIGGRFALRNLAVVLAAVRSAETAAAVRIEEQEFQT